MTRDDLANSRVRQIVIWLCRSIEDQNVPLVNAPVRLGRPVSLTLAIVRTPCYTLLVVNALLTLHTMHLTDNLSVRL